MQGFETSTPAFDITADMVLEKMPPRRRGSRKGENGVVVVVGGSALYHGAPALASLGCLGTGVDLVFTAVPKVISTPIRALSPNLIVFPLPDAKLTRGSAVRLLKWLPTVDASVIGPGLGKQRSEGMITLVRELASRKTKILLDADALVPEVVKQIGGADVVTTPHAGEFKRLFGDQLASDLDGRVKLVLKRAKEASVTVLLKGHVDVVSDGERVGYNKTGCSAMTVGGTGDVLSGLVAGLMARGMTSFDAACCGAYVNGLAGERAAEKLGFHITATDVIAQLPFVLKEFDKEID